MAHGPKGPRTVSFHGHIQTVFIAALGEGDPEMGRGPEEVSTVHPLVLTALASTLTLPALGGDVALPDPLGLGSAEVGVQAEVARVHVTVDPNDLAAFLSTSLPGPGFSSDLPGALEDPSSVLEPGQGASDEGRAIPFPLPEPTEAAVPAGLAVLGAVAYAVARWRLIGPWFLLPLYSRLARGDMLDNEVRAKLHELVSENPGLALQELCKLSGAGWGTTVYHLQRLEQAGLVTSKKQGHHRRFYTVGEVDRRDVDALGILRNETPQAIARYLLESPGCNQKDVCEALGISPSLAHKHLKRLEAQNLVSTERQWRSVHYTPDPKLSELLAQTA